MKFDDFILLDSFIFQMFKISSANYLEFSKIVSSFSSVSLIDAIVLRRVSDTFNLIEDGVKLSLLFFNLLGKRTSSSPTNIALHYY